MQAVDPVAGGQSKATLKPVPCRGRILLDNGCSPGEPLWQSSDNRLRSLTRADVTATTFKLPVWPNPPNDAEPVHQARLITKVLSEMQAQMTAMKEEAIKVEASKMTTRSKSAKNSSQDDKGDKKQPKLKLKQQTEVVDLTPDDLNGAFGALMNKCSQESTKSQQEVSKPASSDVNKSDKSHGDESL